MTSKLRKKSFFTRTMRLLLIEDDEEDRFVIERILKRVPGDRYIVDWIDHPSRLGARLKEERYDAILIDYFLGPKTAGDLVAEISNQSENAAIIVLSGKDASEADEAAFGMAIDFFLSKSDLSPGGIDRSIRYAIRNRDQQTRLRNFSRLVAHDLMGPVGNVRSAAEMLALILPTGDADQKELLEVLRSDCDNLVTTLSALHDFSMSQDGELQPRATPLEGVLANALANLSLGEALTDGRVDCESLPELVVDPNLFTHVFQNLIQNGLKYNKSEAPCVRIEGRFWEGCCELRFIDNGIGIDPAKAVEVFRPMYRLHGSEEYQGTGLGLAVCKEVVERHGGKIWIESRGIEGEGCVVCVRLAAS